MNEEPSFTLSVPKTEISVETHEVSHPNYRASAPENMTNMCSAA
jgi:hypothetical protein